MSDTKCDRKELFGACALYKELDECRECERNFEKDVLNVELSKDDFDKLVKASEIKFGCGNMGINFAVMFRNQLVRIDRINTENISFTSDMKHIIVNGALYTRQ